MTRIWLVVNPSSGSYDAALPDRLRVVAEQGGAEIVDVCSFPGASIPTPAELDSGRIDILAVHTGDGTINAAMHTVAGWGGALLALPGGTMNLLSRHQHDARDAETILLDALQPGAVRRRITMVEGVEADVHIGGLVGVFAGPTTAWGDVRETLRRYDIAGLVSTVPRAIGETFNGAQVRLAGHAERYPAIYLEPRRGKLRVMGFTADDAAQLFEHGFAWLGGDFRDGPHDPLGDAETVTIVSDGGDIGLLVDGERGHTHSPLTLRAGRSRVDFIITRASETGRKTGGEAA